MFLRHKKRGDQLLFEYIRKYGQPQLKFYLTSLAVAAVGIVAVMIAVPSFLTST